MTIARVPAIAYVDRPKAFLHVVRREKVHDARQLQEQIVFEAEHGRRANNRCLGEDAPNHLLTAAL